MPWIKLHTFCTFFTDFHISKPHQRLHWKTPTARTPTAHPLIPHFDHSNPEKTPSTPSKTIRDDPDFLTIAPSELMSMDRDHNGHYGHIVRWFSGYVERVESGVIVPPPLPWGGAGDIFTPDDLCGVLRFVNRSSCCDSMINFAV